MSDIEVHTTVQQKDGEWYVACVVIIGGKVSTREMFGPIAGDENYAYWVAKKIADEQAEMITKMINDMADRINGTYRGPIIPKGETP